MAISQSLLRLALDKAREAGAQRIRRINLRIGRLSGYVPDAVRFNFELLAPGTAAEGASLEIQWVPLSCRCHGCDAQYDAGPDDFLCPDCGGAGFTIVSGREMFIESLEVEE